MKKDSKLPRLIISLMALLLSMPINASDYQYDGKYDFEHEGFYYDIINENVSIVSAGSDDLKYKGDVVIPSQVTYNGKTYNVTCIGELAFYNCINLTSVTIPNSVTRIDMAAFQGCSGLTSVTIPHSVTYIGWGAFSGCSLTSVTIPIGVTYIGPAFDYCQALASIEVESGNQHYDSRNGCNAIIETASNTLIAGCKNTMIPSDITSISYCAFSGCRGLTSVDIPKGVTTIKQQAFAHCDGLTSVTIPGGVKSIEDYAFQGCSGLTSVNIENGVKSVGTAVFKDCISLTSVTIPSSLTCLGDNMFENCISLTSMSIPNTVTDVGWSTFSGCSGLTSVTLPNSITYLYGTFHGCSSLTSVSIPHSVTDIGTGAFYDCSALTSITIPGSVIHILHHAFGGSTELKTIVSEIEEPFEVENVFSPNTYSNELIVPKGTKAKYQNTAGWNRFVRITEGTTDLNTVTTTSHATNRLIYDLQGRPLNSVPRKGIYIQNGKKVVIK